MSTPLVSVLMTVYNGQEFLNIAVDSILHQTYKNLELIIIDDGSTDNSASIIKNYSDNRLRYYRKKNRGLAAALNTGLSMAKGKYIARMDCDDISDPTRLEKQVKFLESNRPIDIVGSSFYLIDENGSYLDSSYHLDQPEDIALETFVRNPYGHGTVMVRAKALAGAGGYDENQPIEDYELWWRILKKGRGANITERLYYWRVVKTGISHGSSKKRQKQIHDLMNVIWHSELPIVSLGQIKSGLIHYEKLGDSYLEQYKYMLTAVCLGSSKMGKRAYGSTLRIKLLLADRSFREVFNKLRENPRSHNYNLSNLYK